MRSAGLLFSLAIEQRARDHLSRADVKNALRLACGYVSCAMLYIWSRNLRRLVGEKKRQLKLVRVLISLGSQDASRSQTGVFAGSKGDEDDTGVWRAVSRRRGCVGPDNQHILI